MLRHENINQIKIFSILSRTTINTSIYKTSYMNQKHAKK